MTRLSAVNDILSGVLDTIRGVDPGLRIVLTSLGMFFETSILIGLIVPGDTIVLIASTATEDWLQWGLLLVSVIVGSLGGESVGFALGRYFGPKIRASRVGRWLGERNWRRAQQYLDRRGGPAVFISRFLPVLHSLLPLTVGMSTMRFRKFLAWTAPACVLWAAAYVSVGWAAAGSYRNVASQLQYAGYLFAGIIVLFVLGVFAIRKLIERSEARHFDHPDDLGAESDTEEGARRP